MCRWMPVQGMGERALKPSSPHAERTRKVALDLERTGQLGRPENEESMGVAMAMEEAGNRIVGSVFRHLV